MPVFSFLVREKLERDRVYSLEAADFEEAEHLLDGFKVTINESQPEEGENLIVWDYNIKSSWKRDPLMSIGDTVKLAYQMDNNKQYVIADILGDHVIIGRKQKKGLVFIKTVRKADLEWTEFRLAGKPTTHEWCYHSRVED